MREGFILDAIVSIRSNVIDVRLIVCWAIRRSTCRQNSGWNL